MKNLSMSIRTSVTLMLFISCGCSTGDVVHIYSPDKSQSLTVLTQGDIQYLIAGEFYEIPDTNYVKLDISKKDLEVENSLNVCWEEHGIPKWDVVISGAGIIENKLDTTKYVFSTELPLDDRGRSTELKFRNEACATISFILKRSTPPSNTTVVFR